MNESADHRGPYRMGTVQCRVDKLFVFNNMFRCIRGNQYWVNNEIAFTTPDKDVDGNYRTIFGPAVCDESVIYRNSNHNFRLSMRRLTCCIEPDIPGLHQMMRANQAIFINSHKWYYKVVRKMYQAFLHEFSDAITEAYLHHADPHPKKELRIQAFKELAETGLMESPSSPWTRRTVLWKMKPNEYAKPERHRKYPRAIVDVGVGGSLLGFRFFEYMKKAQAESPLELHGGVARFIKTPDPFALESAFNELIECPRRLVYIYFSDDSCLSIRINGVVRRFNLDIKSSDASQGQKVFDLLKTLTPRRMRDVCQRLIDQCRLPLKIHDLNDRKIKVVLELICCVLFSGHTGTTCINNIAQLNIFISLCEADIQTPDDIVQAAFRAGYLVTIEEASCPEQLQFLKHSPVRNKSGEWVPMLNLGVFFRASGKCNGDLPGRGPLEVRAKEFQRGLLRGSYPRTVCRLITAMWRGTGLGRFSEEALHTFSHKVIDNDSYPTQEVDDDSIMRRYGLTSFEYQHMCELFENFTYGYSLNSIGMEKVLMLDYGVGLTNLTNHVYFFNGDRT